jgi:pSer/pThr/pTyr-binding forkhead associated (FHA) protein
MLRAELAKRRTSVAIAPRTDEARSDTAAAASVAEPGTVVISSTERSASFHPGGLHTEIRKFPFRIGRAIDHGDHDALSGFGRVDLGLPDHRPYNVSRGHCLIERKGDGYFVRDCGSRLGTIVNGIPLGAEATETTAPLAPGENRLIVGTEGGRHEYLITIA